MITSHKIMIEDKTRCEAYLKAIQQEVKKGDVVVDIGTGSGLLAFFASRAGAKKVYAIESGHIIEDAKKAALANHLEGKVVFVKGLSTAVDLPEKADVIIAELMGSFGINENIVRYLTDAKTRFLRARGKIIPSCLKLFIVPVEAPDIYEQTVGFWEKRLYDISFSEAREQAVNNPVPQTVNPEGILSEAYLFSRLDFEKFDKDETLDINNRVTYSIEREGTLHGFCGWFSATLSKGISLTNAPQSNTTHWRNAFFPVESPILLKKGDTVALRMIIQSFYSTIAWTWTVEIERESATNEPEKTIFKHSTLKNLSLSKEWMLRQRLGNSFIPILSQEDKIRLSVLNECDGTSSAEEIANRLMERFPETFRSIDDALNRVLEETWRCKIKPLKETG